jgi:hypothetical protein
MSKLFITEYANVVFDARGESVLAPEEPALADQTPIDFSDGMPHPSAVFNSQTRYVMIHTDAICSYVVGVNPTATVLNRRMATSETRFFGLKAGGGLSLSVIANT